MSSFRNTRYLDNKRIVYRRDPITDKPTVEADYWDYYENGTYECYQLFRSKAKITTYKSLKWHLLVLWYLNPQLEQEEFTDIADVISSKEHGFTTFKIHPEMTRRMVYEISMLDLDEPPKNKLRKIIFKMITPLTTEDKLRIVGSIIGKTKKVHKDDIYDVMLMLNHGGWKITVARLARGCKCSTRTIHRNMCDELKREKELLNKQL
tara:strand:+ start:193 stop:813 length:621 start_codon:yes stop_codon:yes gene_type:complete